jgi:Protein of unknown function (DUF1524)
MNMKAARISLSLVDRLVPAVQQTATRGATDLPADRPMKRRIQSVTGSADVPPDGRFRGPTSGDSVLGTSTPSRAIVGALTTVLLATGLVAATGGTADAATKISSQYLLSHLTSKSEHVAGYARSKFTLWIDADHDGCDTREEVLIAEAARRPTISSGSGCSLTGGRWVSKYDGLSVTNPSGFDIDHLVPLNEAWQSGAWKWSSATRKAYANDLGYDASLIAVSAHANRSKGDREPQDWMPERASYSCEYVSRWVAVKWRWHLSVNTSERAYLGHELSSCGWPLVAKPTRPAIATDSSSGGSAPAPAPAPAPSAPGTVTYPVHPGSFCSEHGSYGYTAAGTRMRCTSTATDSSFRWRSA